VHEQAGGRRSVARGECGVDAGADVGEADEVGVGVEDDEAQAGLEQQPLDQDAECVGLAGAGLPAEEGVAVEPAGVQPECDGGRQAQLARGQSESS
jgi:hypothetical protein